MILLLAALQGVLGFFGHHMLQYSLDCELDLVQPALLSEPHQFFPAINGSLSLENLQKYHEEKGHQ